MLEAERRQERAAPSGRRHAGDEAARGAVPCRGRRKARVARSGAAAWAVVRRDARLHRSPNAGWPEAAVAGALGLSLSGPRSYGGVATAEPYVNAGGRAPHAGDIEDAVALLWRAWGVLLAIAMAGFLIRLI